MFGRITYVDEDSGYGCIDTRRDDLGELRFACRPGQPYEVDQTVSFEVKRTEDGRLYAANVTIRDERNTSLFNTEDRGKWYVEGEQRERSFLERFGDSLPSGLRLNPQKAADPTAIDLVEGDGSQYADLKTQNTPFFTARRKDASLDPQFTVTFNHKDYQRYKSMYPECKIYFWVNWTQTEWGGLRVQPLEGVWVARFSDMQRAIEEGRVVLHPYKYRVDDEHNAKDSYLFDLRSKIFTRLV